LNHGEEFLYKTPAMLKALQKVQLFLIFLQLPPFKRFFASSLQVFHKSCATIKK